MKICFSPSTPEGVSVTRIVNNSNPDPTDSATVQDELDIGVSPTGRQSQEDLQLESMSEDDDEEYERAKHCSKTSGALSNGNVDPGISSNEGEFKNNGSADNLKKMHRNPFM
mmetsp:Transcript_24510/g.38019  ORF Transcript_24510/g.38019 Transcript_24510/m.38019 type:complete len:112 (-) Transcript_24510:31-366(-)